jgi:proprotein convertase subtilisin/kexin type 5
LSSCPIGYFSTSYQIITVGGQNIETSRCVPCSPICLSCSGVSNNCSSCPSGYILASSTCVSNCSDNGLYYNSATRDCNKCSVTCYSCSGPTTSNCLSCAAPLQLYAGSCLSTCPFGYYPTPTQICQPCGPTCASCSGSPFNCTLCSSLLFLQTFNNIGSCVQSCSVGYYISNGYCQPCNSKCLTCSGPNENQCLSCKSGLFLVSQTCI